MIRTICSIIIVVIGAACVGCDFAPKYGWAAFFFGMLIIGLVDSIVEAIEHRQ